MTGGELRVGSLFAGFGGLDLAVADALGARTAWVCEHDPHSNTQPAVTVLAHRFPGVPNHGDVTEVDWASVEPVEILAGGYPCVAESNAGRRLGDKDPRWMWPAYRETIATLRPRLAIGENVRSHIGRSFRHVVADLQGLGYSVVWAVVSAADVGACHLRERVFWMACPREFGPPAGVGRHPFAELRDGVMVTEDLFGGSPCTEWPVAGAAFAGAAFAGAGPNNGLLPTVRTSDTNGAGTHGDGGLDLRTAVALLPSPNAGNFNDGEDIDHWLARREELRAKGVNGNGMGTRLSIAVRLLPTPDAGHARKQTRTGPLLAGAVEFLLMATPRAAAPRTSRSAALRKDSMSSPSIEQCLEIARGELPREFADWDDLPPSWRQGDGAKGGPNQRGSSGDLTLPSAVQPKRWGPYAGAVARWEAVTRPAPDPTIPGRDGKLRLNPAFAEWMMGAPEGWITAVPGITRTQALKLAGNGVVRQQGAAAVRWLAGRLPDGVLPAGEVAA